MDEINDKGNVNTPITDLLMSTLRQGGCEPAINEYGRACITFRDAQLQIQVNETQRSLTVYDIGWYNVNIYDAKAVIRVKTEVNRVNSFGDAKLVYTENDDDCLYVHTLFTFPFREDIVDKDSYFSDALNAVLSYRQAFIKKESKEEITQ